MVQPVMHMPLPTKAENAISKQMLREKINKKPSCR